MAQRVTTGVSGLDEIMSGGFVKGSAILISGKSGTLKTSFCLSFLKDGCDKGEPGLYVSTEESADDLIEDAKEMFGWDLKESVDKNQLKFMLLVPPYTAKENVEIEKLIKSYVADVTTSISNAAKEIGAKRIVIDSVSMIEMFIENRYLSRLALMAILKNLKTLGVTTLLTEGVPDKTTLLGEEALVEFVVDAVLKLDFVPVAENNTRTISISKMRRTDHSTLIHPFNITKDGLKLLEIKK